MSNELRNPISDPFDRFVQAVTPVYETVLRELSSGRKTSHCMWYVFPQLRGLGRSAVASFYALASIEEARAYLAHPVLGPILRSCTTLVIESEAPSLKAVFGSPDDMKFISSMTIFDMASETGDNLFAHALQVWTNGRRDERTLALLESRVPPRL